MMGWLPPGVGVPPTGGVPPTNRGPGGGSSRGTLSVDLIDMGLWARLFIGYLIPNFLFIGMMRLTSLREDVYIFFVKQ
jgi:hypothetical protein